MREDVKRRLVEHLAGPWASNHAPWRDGFQSYIDGVPVVIPGRDADTASPEMNRWAGYCAARSRAEELE